MQKRGLRRRMKGALPWLTALAILAAVGRLGWAEFSAPPRGEDGCVLGAVSTHRILMLDASDPLHPTILREVARLLVENATQGKPDDRFSLYTVGDGNEPDLLLVFSGCNVASTALAGQKYRTQAAARFLEAPEAFLEGLSTSTRPTTPLFEGLDTLLHRRVVLDAERVELTIASDFLQHSGQASHYRTQQYDKPSFLGRLQPGLIDRVRLVYIQRPRLRHLQTPVHQGFWLDLVAAFTREPPVLEKL